MATTTIASTVVAQESQVSAREPIVVTASAKAMPTTTKFSSDHWVVYKRKAAPAQSTRPTCTHITMRRTFSQTCQVCPTLFPNDYYGMSSVPWVYVCDADHAPSMENSFPALPAQVPSVSADPLNEDTTIAKLYSIGISKPIITLVKQEFYTKDQIDTLIAQRLHVKEVIAYQTTTPKPEVTLPNASAPAIVESSEDGVVEAPWQPRSRASTIIRMPPRITSKCTQTGCPRCRPHFRERACVSFEAVFAGEIPAILPSEISDLPIADVRIVRNIGQRVSRSQMIQSSPTESSNTSLLKSSSTPSTTTIHTSSSSGLEMKERSRRTRVFYSLRRTATSSSDGTTSSHQRTVAFSAGLRHRYQQLKQRWSRKNEGSFSPPDDSRITLPLSGTGALRGFHSAAEDFDLFHLRRKPVIVGGSETEFSPVNTLGEELAAEKQLQRTGKEVEGNGSEVEVDGGVALTEEAVENHTPDVITQI